MKSAPFPLVPICTISWEIARHAEMERSTRWPTFDTQTAMSLNPQELGQSYCEGAQGNFRTVRAWALSLFPRNEDMGNADFLRQKTSCMFSYKGSCSHLLHHLPSHFISLPISLNVPFACHGGFFRHWKLRRPTLTIGMLGTAFHGSLSHENQPRVRDLLFHFSMSFQRL